MLICCIFVFIKLECVYENYKLLEYEKLDFFLLLMTTFVE